MGRMKKNKPRRERPGSGIPNTVLTAEEATEHKRAIAAAEVLDLPVLASEQETGIVLDVAAVGIDGAGLLTGTESAYVRCTDEKIYRLPESLREWASMLVTMHLAHRQAGHPSMFPCRIEFGVLGGGAYAELL
jgi:hypothetical protein